MNDLDTHTLHGGQRQLAREETCPVPCAYSNPSSPITTRGSSDESMLQLTKPHSQSAQNAAVMGLAPPQKASSSGPQSKGAWEPDSSTASLVCKEEPGLDNASTGMCSARPAQGGKRMLRGGGTSSFRGVTK